MPMFQLAASSRSMMGLMRLNMGRLFWKFFFTFFVSQLCVGVGIGLSIWLTTRSYESTGIEASPPARSLVEAAFTTLEYGGVGGLHALLERWQKRRMPQVYAVDDAGTEILGRPLSAATLEAARELVENYANDRYVKRLRAADGHQYLIFVPRFSREKDEPRLQGEPGRPPPLQLDEHDAGELSDRPRPDDIDHPPPRSMKFLPVRPILVGTVVSLFFAAILAWYFSKPIRHLRSAFEEAASGHLDARIGNAMGRRDELADLGRDFDSMAARLGALMQGQTRLLHHVSHELRSPLARLQMAIGLARQSPEKIAASLDRIERESERMDKLVGELLELSRLESGAIRIKLEAVELSELLHTIVEDARFEAEALFLKPGTRPTIRLVEHAYYTLRGQPELLHRAIDNIVRNALKYSPVQGEILLEVKPPLELKADSKNRLETNNKTMQLVITDHGPGVPAAELESIFQPFVRGSTANNGDGHGVGLAIAKQVVEAHGGSIVASNRLQNGSHHAGLQVEIRLPYVSVDTQAQA